MPYLPTTQAFLEQSALLLEAYPETVRNHAQSHMAIPPSISTTHATQYLSPHSHHQLPILISPTNSQTPKQKKHIITPNTQTPQTTFKNKTNNPRLASQQNTASQLNVAPSNTSAKSPSQRNKHLPQQKPHLPNPHRARPLHASP